MLSESYTINMELDLEFCHTLESSTEIMKKSPYLSPITGIAAYCLGIIDHQWIH